MESLELNCIRWRLRADQLESGGVTVSHLLVCTSHLPLPGHFSDEDEGNRKQLPHSVLKPLCEPMWSSQCRRDVMQWVTKRLLQV